MASVAILKPGCIIKFSIFKCNICKIITKIGSGNSFLGSLMGFMGQIEMGKSKMAAIFSSNSVDLYRVMLK